MQEKIKELRITLGLTQAKFAEKIGYSYAAVQNWEKGKPISEDSILRIINTFKVNPAWLRGNDGDMFTDYNEVVDDDMFIYVPLLSDVKAAAGAGYYANSEQATRMLSFRKDWVMSKNIAANCLSAIHVSGDSMYPTFFNGDVLLVDSSQVQPQIDRVFVISTEDGVVVKRSGGLKGPELVLISDNPAISDRIVDLEKEDIRIVGRVVWFGRDM